MTEALLQIFLRPTSLQVFLICLKFYNFDRSKNAIVDKDNHLSCLWKKMNKKTFSCLILTLATAISSGSIQVHAENFRTINDDAAHNLVWKEKLERQISFLTDTICAGRATGTPGANEASFWITRHFSEAGLLPFGESFVKHVFAGQGLVGHNVMGMIPGSRKSPRNSYIIIGAHYDHLGVLGGRMYPGADNNASGVSALLCLSEMFSTMKTIGRVYGKSMIFVAFDAKEMNMAGSEAVWKMIRDGDLADPLTGEPIGPEDIYAMVNMEQIGSSLSPLDSGREDYLIALGIKTLPKDRQHLLSHCNRYYGTHLELSGTYYGSEKFTEVFYRISDQKIFAENGIPSIFFTSGITMNTFKTYDTVRTLNLPVLRKRIILIYHFIEKLLD